MLAYRHAFHAGNHADVLKHAILVGVLQHMNLKAKGYRVIDTHAGAGAYALGGRLSQMKREYDSGIARLWPRADLPPLVSAYVEQVRAYNGDGALRQYPGSPALAHQLMREQDQLRLFELRLRHAQLAGRMRGDTGAARRRLRRAEPNCRRRPPRAANHPSYESDDTACWARCAKP
jgi:23S rRNA (adenine2030-N6)-methyltransferase